MPTTNHSHFSIRCLLIVVLLTPSLTLLACGQMLGSGSDQGESSFSDPNDTASDDGATGQDNPDEQAASEQEQEPEALDLGQFDPDSMDETAQEAQDLLGALSIGPAAEVLETVGYAGETLEASFEEFKADAQLPPCMTVGESDIDEVETVWVTLENCPIAREGFLSGLAVAVLSEPELTLSFDGEAYGPRRQFDLEMTLYWEDTRTQQHPEVTFSLGVDAHDLSLGDEVQLIIDESSLSLEATQNGRFEYAIPPYSGHVIWTNEQDRSYDFGLSLLIESVDDETSFHGSYQGMYTDASDDITVVVDYADVQQSASGSTLNLSYSVRKGDISLSVSNFSLTGSDQDYDGMTAFSLAIPGLELASEELTISGGSDELVLDGPLTATIAGIEVEGAAVAMTFAKGVVVPHSGLIYAGYDGLFYHNEEGTYFQPNTPEEGWVHSYLRKTNHFNDEVTETWQCENLYTNESRPSTPEETCE